MNQQSTVALILQQLSLNESVFIQFVLFGLCVLVLSQLVFKGYFAAFEKREESTKGGEQLASELMKATEELRTQYESEARAVSGSVKTIFDDYRDQAAKECEKIVQTARAESLKLVEEIRRTTFAEVDQASKKLTTEIPTIATAMTNRLLAK